MPTRREACPKCGTPGVVVTYDQQPQGGSVHEVPTGVACPNEHCEWFDPRALRREDAKQAAFRVEREGNEEK
jgi:hypothetical protein